MSSSVHPTPPSDEVFQLRSLARRIQRGDCVLVLGPGAAVAPNVTPEVPLSALLSQQFAVDPRISRTQGLDTRDLRHVSQLLYEATRNLTSLQETAAEFYAGYEGLTTDFHRKIASLPFRVCLTTTHDDFLFNAFVEAGKRPSRRFFSFRRARATAIATPTIEQPFIYYLYGHPEDPDSLVITENDLIDFVASVIRCDPPLERTVRSELAKPLTTCLFIDLGFKNWYLRALLRSLGLFGHQDSSVAIENAEFFRQSEIHQTMLYFSSSQAIQFRDDTLHDFATRLSDAYGFVSRAAARPAPGPQPGQPRVFLSYSHEDRESVDALAERLRAGGVTIWQDHQNLRAGDRWDQALTQVIHKHVDYVVLVQTAAMAGRVESYVGRELNEALRRNQSMLWGFRFLLPVHMGNAPRLPELEPLHSIDVATDEGVRNLIAAILEDWARRGQHLSDAPHDKVGT